MNTDHRERDHRDRARWRRIAGLAFAVAGVSLAAPTPAYAQGGAAQPAPSGAFETPDGQLRFVLDRSGPAALIRFEGDPEVYVLRPDPIGAGGQQIYRTADGSVQLRVTRWGEITVFVRNDRMGAAASFADQAPPLRPASIPAPRFRTELAETQEMVVQRVGRSVSFDAPPQVAASDTGLILDAARRAVDGIAAAPQAPIRRVTIRTGPAPDVAVESDALIITVAPHLGYAGRPSSQQIQAAIQGRP